MSGSRGYCISLAKRSRLFGLLSRDSERSRQVARLLRHGLLSLDEIGDELAIELGTDDRSDLTRLVADTWRRGKQPAAGEPTPLERLDIAFRSLSDRGILCRHYPMLAQSSAIDAIHGEMAAAEHAGQVVDGYCYHDEHGRRELGNGRLFLRYGSPPRLITHASIWRNDQVVGESVIAELQAQRLAASWTGDASDVIWIEEPDWAGPRDDDGAPLVALGTVLEVSRMRQRSSLPVHNVFVTACGVRDGAAHRLLQLIAQERAGDLFGDESKPDRLAATDYEVAGGTIIDLVAGAPPTDARRILAQRDFARAADVIVAVADAAGVRRNTWWSDTEPRRRILVAPPDTAEPVDGGGSAICRVDLETGTGVPALLDQLELTLGSLRSS